MEGVLPPKDIVFSPNAERELKKLTRDEQSKVFDALEKWRSGDAKLDIEKIKSQPRFYRLKAAHLRIIYYPLSAERVVLLVIKDRKDSYKGLGDLSQKLDTAIRRKKLTGG